MRVEKLYEESKNAIDALKSVALIQEAITVESNSGKTLAIAAASAYENDVGEALKGFASAVSHNNPYCTFLISEKVVNRQFHTLFDWKSTTAASFFGLFGTEARKYYDHHTKRDGILMQGVRDFLDLGRSRNEIVHRDYVTYVFEKTIEDVIAQYRSGRYFVQFLESFLREAAEGTLSTSATS